MSWDLATAERARSILNDLIRQRQGMRDAGVDEGLLEANRLGIVYWQSQLTRASSAARQKSEASRLRACPRRRFEECRAAQLRQTA